MSLLIRLAFFDDTCPGDGKLTVGGENLTEEALLDSGKSSYRGPATTSGGRSAPALRESEKGMESGLALVNRKSPCVIEFLHVM
jgi:hypothetical protein